MNDEHPANFHPRDEHPTVTAARERIDDMRIVPNKMTDDEQYAYREFKLAANALAIAKQSYEAAGERLRAAMQALADAAVKK